MNLFNNRMNRYLSKIKQLFGILFLTKEQQARKAGVHMGKGNMVATRFWSTEPYLITIGDNCQLTADVLIHTHGGGGAVRHKIPNFDCFGKVQIGDYVYIGSRSIIMPGVIIGDHVLIAAGSIVTKSIPSNVVVAGNPAKIICTIDEYIKKNLKYNTGTKGMSLIEKKKFLDIWPKENFMQKPFLEL